MKGKKSNIRYLTELALLIAVLLMMNVTGLAMIPMPPPLQYASIMTVPVAIGAMLLGPTAGGILGAVMGGISFYTAVKTGFSSLFLAGYEGGIVVVLSFINSFIPRIIMGVLTGWIFKLVDRIDKTNTIDCFLGGLIAPLLNTLLYMTVLILIYLNAPMLENLLSPELMEKFQSNVLVFVAAYVGVQALIEAGVGCVVSGAITKVLRVILKR